MAKADPVALQELIENSGANYRKGGASYVFTCPRCSKKEKLYLRRTTGQFICFYCAETENFRGRPEYALTEILSIPIDEIRRRLYGSITPDGTSFIAFDLKDFWGNEEPPEEYLLPSFGDWPVDFFPLDAKQSEEAVKYLATRGISPERAQEYGLRYWVTKKRIVFPVYVGDRLIGYQARLIWNGEFVGKDGELVKLPKILTSSKLQRDQVVMFQNRLTNSGHAIITEGPIDAIKSHLCGGNIATMGKVVNRGQLELIRALGIRKIYIALDPDAEAEAQSLARQLGDLECYRLLPGEGFDDLGEMTEEGVLEQFKQARRMNPGHFALNLRSRFVSAAH